MFNKHILTCFLVALAPAADLVGEAIALRVEGLAALVHQDLLCQLILGTEDQ